MKVLFLTRDLSMLGGVERVIEALTTSLSKYHDCGVLTLVNAPMHESYNINSIQCLGLESPKNKFAQLKYHIKTFLSLSSIIKNNGCEYIVANSPSLSCLTILASLFNKGKVKVICYEHNTFLFPNIIWRTLRRILFSHAHATIALTKDTYIDYIGINANPIQVYNPITIKPGDRSRCDGFNVLALGRLTKQKGFDMLIDAWSIVASRNKKLQLHIVGDGDERDSLEKKIADLSLQESITIHKADSNVQAYYSTSDLFVMTSRYEGFPLVLAEAMAHGLPVVSFDCKSGPSDIINNKNGCLIKSGDIVALANKILTIFDDRDYLKRLSDGAMFTSRDFDIDEISKKWNQEILT